MTIKKITNLNVVLTEEVVNRKWAELLGRRNSLLINSDWTQLLDCEISVADKRKWKKWRESVRELKRSEFDNFEDAKAYLMDLEENSPEHIEIEDVDVNSILTKNNITNLETQIEELQCKMNSILETGIKLSPDVMIAKTQVKNYLKDQYIVEYTNDYVLDDIEKEKFDQAMDYLSTHNSDLDINDFPLIKLYASKLNKTPEDIANLFLKNRKIWMRNICNLEEKYLEYNIKVDSFDNVDQLKEFLNGI